MTPRQFCDRWPDKTQSKDVVLVDVRESRELEIASISGAHHIPMGEITARIEELDRDSSLVVMCHSGGRSRQVAGYLLAVGFENVFNLAGGIEAWSQTIDSQIPRY
ncbi:MAG: rhodanese-like domain-containing protein [Candidatus Rariloculaceae bacterium]